MESETFFLVEKEHMIIINTPFFSKEGFHVSLQGCVLLLIEESLHQMRLVIYLTVYKVYTSQVVPDFFHQQYLGGGFNFFFHPLPGERIKFD